MTRSYTILRHGSRFLLAAVLAIIAACRIVQPFDSTNMPDDATLRLSFACPNKRVIVSGNCTVHGLVLLPTEDFAGSGWTLDLLASAGAFVGVSSGLALRVVTNSAGEVIVPFRAPSDTGWVKFTLASHGTRVSDSIRVVNADLDTSDEPPVAVIQLSPSNVQVRLMDSVLVTATFLDGSKKALPGKRGFFSVEDPSKAGVPAIASERHWVKGLDTGITLLRVSRRAVIGTARVEVIK